MNAQIKTSISNIKGRKYTDGNENKLKSIIIDPQTK